jgi:hypothetical protein
MTIISFEENWKSPHNPVKAFFPPPEDPAGMTFNTLNLTVFDNGLKRFFFFFGGGGGGGGGRVQSKLGTVHAYPFNHTQTKDKTRGALI